MAKPKASAALSTWGTVAPSSTSWKLWRTYCSNMRLPMKPSHTPDTTATFLIFLATCMTVAITSLAVCLLRTTSSRRITLAGLKKCRPTTSCGRLVTSAILSTSSVEVFDARMAPGFITASSLVNTWAFTSMFSNTASMTMSAWTMSS